TLTRLQLENGQVDGNGGCLLNEGTTVLDNASIQDCVANQNASNEDGFGGGVASHGTLTVVDSTIRFNTADVKGGGIWARSSSTFDMDNTFVGQNVAITGAGGGVLLEGSVQSSALSFNTWSDNEALVGGG